MMQIILLILFQMTTPPNNSISKNGMTVEWTFIDKGTIKFRMASPSNGWIAIGLNTKNQLIGSNLIMAAVSKNQKVISDRYIADFGDHRPVEDFGAQPIVKLLSAENDNSGTEIEFVLSTIANDGYHFHLEKGKKYYLIMAYSHEDDFNHHSAMRTSVEIIL